MKLLMTLGRAASTAFFLVCVHLSTWADEAFLVQDIRVEGLQRVEPGTVFATLPFQIGDPYNNEKASSAIAALFALGLFQDVRIDVQGKALVVIVQERPTIADISFTGVKEFDKDLLLKSLRDIGLSAGRAFDNALADRSQQELKRQYLNRSLYGAQVVTTVTPAERNQVSLNFNVVEGEVAKIKALNIVGAQAFRESTLLGLFDLDDGGWLSWYTKSNRYSRAKLNADLEQLRSFYLSRGYLEFKVESTQVSVSADKKSISITVNISEGARFVVSGVSLAGDYLGKDEEFKALVKIVPGKPYNAELVTATTQAFSDYFGSFGYAFAQVQAEPLINRANNTVAIRLLGDASRRAYVRKINIAGNNRTRDEVIRREFRQQEASWYDGEKIKLSRDRVDRLGYFKSVDVETAEVPGANDQLDVNLRVEEKSTGNISLGAGFSSGDELSLQFKVQQENIFGSGQYLSAEVNTSKLNRVLALTTTDPYFTRDGVSRTVDVYIRDQKPQAGDTSLYRLNGRGGSIRFGIPFSEEHKVFFGLGVDQTDIVPGSQLPQAYTDYIGRVGLRSSLVPLTVAWNADTRDSALVPSSGSLRVLSGEWGVGGKPKYVRATAQYQQYIPIDKRWTFAFNTELGWGRGSGDAPYPVFKTFYAGGLGSVRGFEQGTLGPVDSTGAYLGGTKKVVAAAELQAPFPGAGNDRTLRLFAFADVGNVFGGQEKFEARDLRASAGFGLSWVSPIGPLRLSAGYPIRSQTRDKIQRIQFQIGTAF